MQKPNHTTCSVAASNSTGRRRLSARWVLPISGEPLENGVVELDGNRIVAVLPRSQADLADLADLEDYGNAIILPGLINLHTHIEISHLQGLGFHDLFEWIPKLVAQLRTWQEGDFRQSALSGARSILESGTSCIVDSAYNGQAAVAVAQSGLRALVGLEIFGLTDPEGTFETWKKKLAALTDPQTETGRLIQDACAAGRLQLTVAPHAPYTVSPALMRKAADFAAQRGTPILVHVAESEAECRWLALSESPVKTVDKFLTAVHGSDEVLKSTLSWRKKDLTPVQLLAEEGLLSPSLLAAHAVQLTNGDINLIAKSGCGVVHCPRSNALLGNGVANLSQMAAAGVRFGFGTDSAASNFDLNLINEARAACLLQRGRNPAFVMPATDIIYRLTAGAAAIIGWGDRIGALQPGMLADIAVFEGPPASGGAWKDPCEFLLNGPSRLLDLFVDGRKVVNNSV